MCIGSGHAPESGLRKRNVYWKLNLARARNVYRKEEDLMLCSQKDTAARQSQKKECVLEGAHTRARLGMCVGKKRTKLAGRRDKIRKRNVCWKHQSAQKNFSKECVLEERDLASW